MSTRVQEVTAQYVSALTRLQNPDTTPEVRQKVDQFLRQFEYRQEAWYAADQILRHVDKYDAQIQLHAAFLLRAKLRFHFEELPKGQYIPFRESLLQHVLRFMAGPQVLTERLALCVAALFVHLAGTESWSDPLTQLTALFTKPASSESIFCLFNILTVVPEECQSRDIEVSHEQLRKARIACQGFQKNAVAFLTQCLQKADGQVRFQVKVFECFAAWIKYGMIDPANLAKERIFLSSFDALKSRALFPMACEVLTQTMVMTDDFRRYQELINVLVPKVILLGPFFQKCLHEKDIESCKQLSYIFIEMGESYLHFLLEFNELSIKTLKTLVLVTSHPDKTISSNTYHFWERFVREIIIVKKQDRYKAEKYKEKLVPMFEKLLMFGLRVMVYPADLDLEKEKEEKDKQDNFRDEASDFMKDCTEIIGAQRSLNLIFGELKTNTVTLSKNWPRNWQETEAALYSVRSLSRDVQKLEPSESTVIPNIFRNLGNYCKHPRLQVTIIKLIGRYGRWLAVHPEYLEPALLIVIQGLSKPQQVSIAAEALISMCKYAATPISQNPTCAGNMVRGCPRAKALPFSHELEFITATCYVISAMPSAKFTASLQECLKPIVQQLRVYAYESSSISLSPERRAELENAIKRVAQFYIDLEPSKGPEPEDSAKTLVQLTRNVFPILLQIFNRYIEDLDVVEKVTRTFKHAMNCLGPLFLQFLQPVFQTLVPYFQRKPHSSILYLLGKSLDLYGHGEHSNSSLRQYLFKQLIPLCTGTLAVLNTDEKIRDSPEFVEDLAYLMLRSLKATPDFLVQGEGTILLESTVKFCLRAIPLQQNYDSSKSVFRFLETLLRKACPSSKVADKKEEIGAASAFTQKKLASFVPHYSALIANSALASMCGALPSSHSEFCMDVLQQLMKFCGLNGVDVQSVLLKAARNLPQSSDDDCRSFLDQFMRAERDRDREDAIWAFSDVCRKRLKKHGLLSGKS